MNDPLAPRVVARFAAEAHPKLTHAEVAKLPAGSIVYEKDDSNGSNAYIVDLGGKLFPVSLLSERAGGHIPEGESVASLGNEFGLVTKGHGKLPTHATAVRAIEQWQRNPKAPKVAHASDEDAIRDILEEIEMKVDPGLLETLAKGLEMHVEHLPEHGGQAGHMAQNLVQMARNLKSILRELRARFD